MLYVFIKQIFGGKQYTMHCAADYEKKQKQNNYGPNTTELEGQIRYGHSK